MSGEPNAFFFVFALMLSSWQQQEGSVVSLEDLQALSFVHGAVTQAGSDCLVCKIGSVLELRTRRC